MFSITWGTYLTASFVFIAIYYACALLYFKRKGQVLGKSTAKQPAKWERQPLSSAEEAPASPQPVLFKEQPTVQRSAAVPESIQMKVQALVTELQAFLAQSAAQKISKEDLLTSIPRVLVKYPGVAGSEFQTSINTLIAVTLENNCAIHLSADEIAGLW